MELQRKLLQFLKSEDKVLGLVGPPGAGKKHAVQAVAQKQGFACREYDRSMGPVNWGSLSAFQLCASGLNPCVTLIVNAQCETCFSWVKNLSRGVKVICIADDAQHMRHSAVPIEYVRLPTAEQMTKSLFLESGWPLIVAQRVVKYSGCDWRQAMHIRNFFEQAGCDIESLPDDVWEQRASEMSKDGFIHAHPSLAAHKLFREDPGRGDVACDDQVVAWGERNLGLLTDTLEDMCSMQEEACFMDVLSTNGQQEIGLDCFARRAATMPKSKPSQNRYDYKMFVNPWTKPPKADDLRRSTFAERQKQRLTQKEARSTPSSKKRAKPKRASTKRK